MNALQIAMLEDKIKEYVVNELKQLKSVMVANQNKALKNMSQKHVNQTNRLVRGFSRKIKENESLYKSNLGASAVYESSRIPSMSNSVYEGQQQPSNPGQNILATKLLEDIQEAIAAETLNWKPIEGADIPLKQVKYGRGGELLLVQDLTQAEWDNKTEDSNITKEALENHFNKNMYKYLVPSGFKKYKHNYLDEEDLFSIKEPIEKKPKIESKEKDLPAKDKTKLSQKELREKKEEELFKMKIKEGDDPDDKTTIEERDRTIKLMVKLLSRHVEDAKEESKQLSSFFRETENKINNFKKELDDEETKVILDDIKRRKDIAEKEMEESLASADNLKSIRDTRLDDLMVDNQVMLAQIELFEKKKGIIPEEELSDDGDLSDIDIQQLAYSDEKPKKK